MTEAIDLILHVAAVHVAQTTFQADLSSSAQRFDRSRRYVCHFVRREEATDMPRRICAQFLEHKLRCILQLYRVVIVAGDDKRGNLQPNTQCLNTTTL